uniref:ENTH domain-containing protein n=1 Tax=Timema genevievae TaxID=629358 RepID=A0A7R9JPI4_TIMGE|nr:unnamed protein product [Timema genevievae]
MRRQKEDMQVNVAGLRRNIKNLAHNYSDAQVKVREATSNDPWGPSSTLMSEIADLTYNVVAQQCKENIFAIQTLKDFQYLEECKDQGLNVREKAKQLVSLLKDDERLRNERARALKAKERFAQAASGFGSDGMETLSPSSPGNPSLETARPQTIGEEELQLQLALAMSREEAEQEEQKKRSDDVRLQLALSQSEEEFKHHLPKNSHDKQSHMLDLLDVDLGNPSPHPPVDPWGFPHQRPPQSPPIRPQNDPWNSPAVSAPSAQTISSGSPVVDPWAPTPVEPVYRPAVPVDPWRAVSPQPPPRPVVDPWSPSTNTDHSSPGSPRGVLTSPDGGDLDEFDIISTRERPSQSTLLISNANNLNNNGGTLTPDPFDLNMLGESLTDEKQSNLKKTPQSFLGENSALVNLDNLVTVSTKPTSTTPVPAPALSIVTANPFTGVTPVPAAQANLFQPQTRPSINQIRQQPFMGSQPSVADNAWGGASALPTPLLPSAQPNPFLS